MFDEHGTTKNITQIGKSFEPNLYFQGSMLIFEFFVFHRCILFFPKLRGRRSAQFQQVEESRIRQIGALVQW